MRSKYIGTRKAKFQVVEVIIYAFLLVASVFGAYCLTHACINHEQAWFADLALWIVIVLSLAIPAVTILIDSQFKTSVLYRGWFGSMGRSLFSVSAVNVITYLICYFALKEPNWLGYFFLIHTGMIITTLGLMRLIIRARYRRKKRTIAVVGTQEEVEWFAKKFLVEHRKDRDLRYLLYEEDGVIMPSMYPLLNHCDDVYLTSNLKEYNKNQILMYCAANKEIAVHIVPQIYEIGIVDSLANQVDDVLTLEISGFHLSFGQRFAKRALDIFCSIVGLLVFWPLMLVTAIIIKCQDGGSPIYKQERVTLNGKSFMLYKFRTMVQDAEKNTGAVLASSNDQRITKFGKLIRMTRIDELPQLWNVLKGEMSFIGPRPERSIFVSEFLRKTPSYKYRMNVKAGIAGLAQVRGNYDTNYRDKLRWDLLYIKNYSIMLDVKIVFWTLRAVFDRESSRGVSHTLPLCEFFQQYHYDMEAIDQGWIVTPHTAKTSAKAESAKNETSEDEVHV